MDDRKKARSLVTYAIKKGVLKPLENCESCGNNPGFGKDGRNLIQAHHHKGYSKEFIYDVKWLCISCHRKEHPSGLQATPWKARWDGKDTCPQGHKNSFGINNRGHRFCRKCSNNRRRLAL